MMTATYCYYVIDSSSLINLMKWNPMDIYPTVWIKLANLINKGLLISPDEVKKELAIGDDELTEWADKNPTIFRCLNKAQMTAVFEIASKFPKLIDAEKETPDADPFVIALAKEKSNQTTLDSSISKKIVVTEEKPKGQKVNIPFVCANFGIDCICLHELFRREKWTF